MAGQIRVTYEQFGAGEYGQPGGAHAPDGSFTGRNVRVYRNGLIGPRAGIKITPLGPSGTIYNAWRIPSDGISAPSDLLWVTTAGDVKKAVTSSNTITSVGSITAPSRPPQVVHLGGGKFVMTSFQDKCYLIDLAANTTTAITGSPGGTTIAMVNDRVFVGNDGGGGFARVFYTDPAAFTAFPPANFFDVGARSGIGVLVGQRDHLSIGMEDGSWWVYRGVGDAASLRKVTTADWPNWSFNPHAAANMTDDIITEMTSLGDWPAFFDGAALNHEYQYGPRGNGQVYFSTEDIRVLPNIRPGEAAIILPDATNGARLYLRQDGAWTIHTLPTTISYIAAPRSVGGFTLCNKTAPAFYYLDTNLERPAFTSDTYARPGDLSDTPLDASFTLPEWWSPPGTEIRVKQVIVDFLKYNTGASGTNNITLGVTSFGLFNSTDGTESPGAQSWNEAVSAGTTGGKHQRHVFNVGEQGYGAGFQLTFTALRGVAIRGIYVELDSQPSMPRG